MPYKLIVRLWSSFSFVLFVQKAHLLALICALLAPVASRASQLPVIQPTDATTDESVSTDEESDLPRKTIRSISIDGNKLVTQEAVLARLPYRVSDPFDPSKTADLIHNLYGLNFFNNVIVDIEDVSDTQIDLFIRLEEKKKIEAVCYEGLYAVTQDEIEKKLKLSEIPAMDEEELDQFGHQLRKLYAEKNYHAVAITASLEPTSNGAYKAVFKIVEGPQASVKRIFFKGNNCVSSKTLRSITFTREDWLFGFMSKAGSYQPEMLEGDKYMIENYYQSNGFLAARVVDTQVDIDPTTQCITITFTIEEGDLFTIQCATATGNDICTSEQLQPYLSVRAGQLYSRELIRKTMDTLRTVWGRYGYIYVDIEPVVIPNFETKTVDVTFETELGNKVYLNRINIIGNTKTRDYVIRRMLPLCEGQLLTIPAMDISKNRVEALGYFDPLGGVEWKTNKISEDKVDLDLVLKEMKTGRVEGRISYGGNDPQSPNTSIGIGFGVSDRNLWGTGIRANINGSWSAQDRNIAANIYQPWLFNRPIGAGLGIYHRKSIYENFSNVTVVPEETLTGGNGSLGFNIPSMPDATCTLTGGVERIQFNRVITPDNVLQSFVNQRFISGTTGFVTTLIGQDARNHPVMPNRGYNWSFNGRVGIPVTGSSILTAPGVTECKKIGYFKADFDATWYTPLIGDYDLIFLLHGHAGFVKQIGNNVIPYRDLYNMGGPGTVRGFEFGQIGPQLLRSSIGATKAFWVNAELVFSITKDQSMRGVLFYDGGAGWDTPLTPYQERLLLQPENAGLLTNNRFQYRHSVGFGIRLTNPAPIRIDWGFKLDRNKRLGEKFYAVHFTMSQDF